MSFEGLDDLAEIWPELVNQTWDREGQQDSSPDQAPQWQQPQPEPASQQVLGWPNTAPEPDYGALPLDPEGNPVWTSTAGAMGLPHQTSGEWPQNARAMKEITASQLQQPHTVPASQQMLGWPNTAAEPQYSVAPLMSQSWWPSTNGTMAPPVVMSGESPRTTNCHYQNNMAQYFNHFTSLPRQQNNAAALPVHYNLNTTLPVHRNFATSLPVNQNNQANLPVNNNNGQRGVYGTSHSLAGPASSQHTGNMFGQPGPSNQAQPMQVSENKINPTEAVNTPRFNITITSNGIAKKIPKRKRVRTAFTTDQILALERIYSKQAYVSKDERQVLTERLKISDRAIKVWFQNRRMKGKRAIYECSDKCEPESTDPELIEAASVPRSCNNSNGSSSSDIELPSAFFPDNLIERSVVPQERVVYEPISPADMTSSEAEEVQWKVPLDEKELQDLFDRHFC